MDYIKLSEVAETFLANAVTKSQLSVSQLLLRGFLSGALLGFPQPSLLPRQLKACLLFSAPRFFRWASP